MQKQGAPKIKDYDLAFLRFAAPLEYKKNHSAYGMTFFMIYALCTRVVLFCSIGKIFCWVARRKTD